MILPKLSVSAAMLLTGCVLFASGLDGVALKYGLTSLDNDDGWKLKNHTIALDARWDIGYPVKPRLDLSYIDIDKPSKWGGVSSLWQVAAGLEGDLRLDQMTIGNRLYLFGGIGYEYVQDGTDVFDSQPFIQGGVGASFQVTDRVALLTELRALQVVDNNHADDDEDNEFTLFIGVDFPLSQPAPKPVIKETREVTPPPVVVPAPVVAPEPVVTIPDSDNDGVPDDQDDCPGTVLTDNMEVNSRGCEIIPVKDSDGDMVPDDQDKCPNTPEGAQVDDNGCAVLMRLDIHFDTGSAHIRPESMEKIKLFARYLRQLPPGSVVTITGHTDNVGNEKYNRKLSYKRAVAVRKAILDQGGIDWRMIKAAGKGSSEPIADNSTLEGRAKNRRIEVSIKQPEVQNAQ